MESLKPILISVAITIVALALYHKFIAPKLAITAYEQA
jgi:hypothetical protein